MPVLPNQRHEAFAQALAKGKSADEAYQLAGYAENRGNAARLKANERIRKRVEDILGRMADKAEWTAADRLRSLKRIHEATEGKDPRTAIAALAEANKMQGSYAPTKHAHSGPNGGPIPTVDLTNATDEDLDRLEALFGPLAGAAGDDAEADQAGEGEASS
jgi:phage terminase small subunit